MSALASSASGLLVLVWVRLCVRAILRCVCSYLYVLVHGVASLFLLV